MTLFRGGCLKLDFSRSQSLNQLFYRYILYNPFEQNSAKMHNLSQRQKLDLFCQSHTNPFLNMPTYIYFSSNYSTGAQPRSAGGTVGKTSSSSNSQLALDESQFKFVLSQLPPRFVPEELCNLISLQEDPLICLELFNWAKQQRRFQPDLSTYHLTIKKLGAAKMYKEMDNIVDQVLSDPCVVGSEALYNTIIYYFTETRKLARAVTVFKHMKNCRDPDCRPSIRTYNLLFAAFLSRGRNPYVNHTYMETIRFLFRQMLNDGIEPDIFSLNSMVKGYVLSLHVNDALRIFHQMGVVYNCKPNSFTYDYLIHGLCAQGRTQNAQQLCHEMETKGYVPSGRSYNSLVNALALNGEIDEAVKYLWEMIEKLRLPDLITFRTLLDELCRRNQVGDAVRLLKELQERRIVSRHAYQQLANVLKDDFRAPAGNPVQLMSTDEIEIPSGLYSLQIQLGHMGGGGACSSCDKHLKGGGITCSKFLLS